MSDFFLILIDIKGVTLLSKCKKSEKTSECQFTRKRVKATQKSCYPLEKERKEKKK